MEEKTYTYNYPHPAVTTDCVIFGFDGHRLQVLLVERGIEPFKGKWALPGGFLGMDETPEECALRELREETGLETAYMEQLQAFGDVRRDPRERVITIAFYALVRLSEVRGGDDAADAKWFPLDEVPPLAFDHEKILREAKKRIKERIHFRPIGFELLDEVLSMQELQTLYEEILEVKFDRRNFYKKMLSLGLLDPVTPADRRKSGRARVEYQFNSNKYDEMKESGFKLEF